MGNIEGICGQCTNSQEQKATQEINLLWLENVAPHQMSSQQSKMSQKSQEYSEKMKQSKSSNGSISNSSKDKQQIAPQLPLAQKSPSTLKASIIDNASPNQIEQLKNSNQPNEFKQHKSEYHEHEDKQYQQYKLFAKVTR